MLILTVHQDFLTLLFRQRKAFHTIARQAALPNAPVSIVVCWVDGVLAKLADAIAWVGCGCMRLECEQLPGEGLRLQQEDSVLRAAAQLPRQFCFPSIFLSCGSKSD